MTRPARQRDDDVWKSNFGATLPVGGGAASSLENQPPALPGVMAATSAVRDYEIESRWQGKPPAKPGADDDAVAMVRITDTARRDLALEAWVAGIHRGIGADDVLLDDSRVKTSDNEGEQVTSDVALECAFATL